MDKDQIRETIAKRAALEIHDGAVVNLGIGLPTAIAEFLPSNIDVTLHSENGLLGIGTAPQEGEEDVNYTNAGGGFISYTQGASTFDSATSFGIIRGGHIDITFLGALEVDTQGNLANWIIPGKKTPGMGGAMDLIVGARRVILTMEHTSKGAHKIVEHCQLPLTAVGQVNTIITEMGVMHISPEGIVLSEIHPDYSVAEVQAATGAKLVIDKNLKLMPI